MDNCVGKATKRAVQIGAVGTLRLASWQPIPQQHKKLGVCKVANVGLHNLVIIKNNKK